MYELTIESNFSSAHNLREYEGACERLHGHNWRVEVSVRAESLDKRGIAVDFKTLKAETEKVIGALDHRYLNEIPPFEEQNPSAENIARFIFTALAKRLDDGNVKLRSVRVWESERASAAYYD